MHTKTNFMQTKIIFMHTSMHQCTVYRPLIYFFVTNSFTTEVENQDETANCIVEPPQDEVIDKNPQQISRYKSVNYRLVCFIF